MTHRIIAGAWLIFDSPDGTFPPPEEIGAAVAQAMNAAILSKTDGGWGVTYTPPAEKPAKKVNWYDAAVAELQAKNKTFKAHRAPDMHWYRQPDANSKWFYMSTDTGEMTILGFTTDAKNEDWFQVFKSDKGDIWVKAKEAQS